MEKIKKNIFCSGHDCFKDDYFNSNLSNGNITHLTYKNLSVEQNPNIIYSFNKLINYLKPRRVLEIGTFAGGLTLLIRDILDYNELYNSDVITYDVVTPNYLINQISEIKIISKTKNLFSDNYEDFQDETSKNEIFNLIQKEGVTLVLCDGGSKKNEFKLITPLLKKGDVIMEHDYSSNEEYFNFNVKNKYWNWMEIQDSDIIDVVNKNNLTPCLQEDFNNVAWVCKIKN